MGRHGYTTPTRHIPPCPPARHGQPAHAQDFTGVAPLVERKQHIRAHKQIKFCIAILFLQCCQRIAGVALPAAGKLQAANLKRFVWKRKATHLHPICPARELMRLLMRRKVSRDNEHPLKPKRCASVRAK